jgi:O-succinylbenzoic acid--CoA ligase
MEVQKLNQLFTQYAQDEKVFFKTKESIFLYCDLIKKVFSIAHLLEKSHHDFFALKLNDPFLVFCYVLAAPLAQKKLLLLSPMESSELSEKHSQNIPYDEIITEQHSIHSMLEAKEQLFYLKDNFEEAFLFLLSSGSSGQPKGIGHSLLTLVESASRIVNELGMKQDEITFLNLPVHHVGGLMIFWRSFLSGGSVSTIKENYDYASFVPLQLERMLNDEHSILTLKQSKAILIGGSKLSDELKKKTKELGVNVFETYGMTETASAVLLNGKPIPGQTIKIEKEKILIKGPTLAVGVFQNRKLLPLPLNSVGFYVTNDRGIQIDQKHFQFIERLDLNFKSGGELINPLVIEQCLKELPWIKEAIVTSVFHPEWTEATTLLYEANSNVTNAEELIKNHIRSKLHPHMVPKYIFPYLFSETGLKPARFRCKEMARKLQSLEIIDHSFIESTKDTKKLAVFIHGFLGDKTDMEEWTKVFSNENTSYLFLSLPGHGETEIKYFIDREDILNRISDVITFYQQTHPLYLYGYSMGGRVSLQLALTHLNVTKLILESASFGLETTAENEDRLKADQILFKNFSLTKWYSAPLFGNYNQSSRFKSDLEKKKSHDYQEWAKAIDLLSPGRDSLLNVNLKSLEEKKIDVTLIVGSEDKKYFQHYQSISSKHQFPLYVVRDAAHNPHKTHPLEIQTIMLDLLENTPD